MWFVRKSRYQAIESELVETKADLAALQIHCDTLQAENDLILAQLKESEKSREQAENLLRESKPARKRSPRKKKRSVGEAGPSSAGQ